MNRSILDHVVLFSNIKRETIEQALTPRQVVIPARNQHPEFMTEFTFLFPREFEESMKRYTRKERAYHGGVLYTEFPHYGRKGIEYTINEMIRKIKDKNYEAAFNILAYSFENDYNHKARFDDKTPHLSLFDWMKKNDIEYGESVSYMHNMTITNPADIDYTIFKIGYGVPDGFDIKSSHNYVEHCIKTWFRLFVSQFVFLDIKFDFS